MRSVQGLPPNFAARAINTKLLSGELRGLRDLVLVHEFPIGSTFQRAVRVHYPDGVEFWIGLLTHDADTCRSQIVNDLFGRVYILDAGAPYPAASLPKYNTRQRMTLGEPPIILGVPAPTSTLIVLPPASGTGLTTRAYVETFVTDFGEEGPPGPSTVATGQTGPGWVIGNITGAAASPYSDAHTINSKRLYRTVTGADGTTTFFKVADIPILTSFFNDDLSDIDLVTLGIQLPSIGWDPPPLLQGMLQLPGGSILGWNNNQVYFSEPGHPHAWPVKYQISLESNIIGAGIFLNTVVFGTDSFPYGMTVSNPSNIDLQKINVVEPCLSKTSVVSSLEGVYYASQNGLVLASSMGFQVISQSVISQNEWLSEYVPRTITAARQGTKYIGISSPGEGFVFDSLDPRVSVVDLQGFANAQYIWNDAFTGLVYVMVDNGVYCFDTVSAPEVTYRWMSKEFTLPAPINMGAGLVYYDEFAYPPPNDLDNSYTPGEADAYTAPPTDISVELAQVSSEGLPIWDGSFIHDLALPKNTLCFFRVYAKRKLVFSMPVQSNKAFRLPSGYKSDTYQLEVVSRRRIFKMAIAETARALEKI